MSDKRPMLRITFWPMLRAQAPDKTSPHCAHFVDDGSGWSVKREKYGEGVSESAHSYLCDPCVQAIVSA